MLAGPEYRYKPRRSTAVHLGAPTSVATSINAQDLPASSGGAYVGKRRKTGRRRPWTLEELKRRGFRVIAWDGR